jgi:hypothetical protein
VTQTVRGLGGVGTIQLVAAWFAQHCDEYEIAAWIAAERGGVEDFLRLADGIGVPASDDVDQRLAGLKARLETSDTAWLMVLDNVASLDDLLPVAHGSGGGRASRRSSAGRGTAGRWHPSARRRCWESTTPCLAPVHGDDDIDEGVLAVK